MTAVSASAAQRAAAREVPAAPGPTTAAKGGIGGISSRQASTGTDGGNPVKRINGTSRAGSPKRDSSAPGYQRCYQQLPVTPAAPAQRGTSSHNGAGSAGINPPAADAVTAESGRASGQGGNSADEGPTTNSSGTGGSAGTGGFGHNETSAPTAAPPASNFTSSTSETRQLSGRGRWRAAILVGDQLLAPRSPRHRRQLSGNSSRAGRAADACFQTNGDSGQGRDNGTSIRRQRKTTPTATGSVAVVAAAAGTGSSSSLTGTSGQDSSPAAAGNSLTKAAAQPIRILGGRATGLSVVLGGGEGGCGRLRRAGVSDDGGRGGTGVAAAEAAVQGRSTSSSGRGTLAPSAARAAGAAVPARATPSPAPAPAVHVIGGTCFPGVAGFGDIPNAFYSFGGLGGTAGTSHRQWWRWRRH